MPEPELTLSRTESIAAAITRPASYVGARRPNESQPMWQARAVEAILDLHEATDGPARARI